MNNIKNQDITITPRLRNGKHLNVPVSISDVENFTAKFYTKDISHSIDKEQPNGNDITLTWNELLTIAEGELIAFYSYDYDGQHIQYPEATKNYIDNNLSEGKDTEFSLSIGGGSTPQPQSIPDIVKGMWNKVTYNVTEAGEVSIMNHNHDYRYVMYVVDGQAYNINTTDEVKHTFSEAGIYDIYYMLGAQNGTSGYRYDDNFIFKPVIALNLCKVEYTEWNCFLAMTGVTDLTINAVSDTDFVDANELGELGTGGTFHVKNDAQKNWLQEKQQEHTEQSWSSWDILTDATEVGEDFLAVQALDTKVSATAKNMDDRINGVAADIYYIHNDINELMQDMKMKKVYYSTTDGEQLGGSIGTTWSGATVVYNSVDANHNGTITFDRPVLEVPNDTFKEKSNLTGITLPPTITSIGGDSIRETGIYEIVIPYNATIGSTAFYGCNNLRRVVFNGANSIGANAFGFSFRNADNVDFDTSNSTIYQTVEGCLTSGSTLIVGNPKTGVIPEGIEVIASNSIAGYGWLNSITLPSTVTSIQNEAITFMDTITITCYATTPPTMGNWQPLGYNTITAIYVPAESVDAYKEADGWSDFASVISAIIN